MCLYRPDGTQCDRSSEDSKPAKVLAPPRRTELLSAELEKTEGGGGGAVGVPRQGGVQGPLRDVHGGAALGNL